MLSTCQITEHQSINYTAETLPFYKLAYVVNDKAGFNEKNKLVIKLDSGDILTFNEITVNLSLIPPAYLQKTTFRLVPKNTKVEITLIQD